MFNVSPEDFPANAMEVMNSGSQQTNPRQLYMDWMKLIARGVVLTPIGSSDSHDVSRFIVGQSRTYVRRDSSVFHNIITGRAGVSFGLFTELVVHIRKKVTRKISVSINVYSPSWVKAETIALYVNGETVYTSKINPLGKSGLVSQMTFHIPRPAPNSVLVAIAEGPDPKVPWWPVAKPYQHSTGEVNPIVLGISEAVRVN
jgi:hypothetical protein